MRLPWLRSILGFLLVCSSAIGAADPATPDPCPSGTFVPLGLNIRPENPCDGDSVSLVVSSCAPCVRLVGADPASLTVKARMFQALCMLRVACFPDTLAIPLGRLRAGSYSLDVTIAGDVVQPDSSVCTTQRRERLTFQVRRDCSAPGLLPYLDVVEIGTPVVCIRYPCPPMTCPLVDIPVRLAGHFGTDCMGLERVEILPSELGSPVPTPARVRIVYASYECLGQPCGLGEFPWRAHVALPGLPPGGYELPLEAVLVHRSCIDSLVEHLGSIRVPFVVVPDCPPPSPSCFVAEWHGAFDQNPCDAFVGPTHPATLTLELTPTVALAGFQGELAVDSLGLRVTGIQPVGPATGMHLDWLETPRGARFVMFADHGAPIPPHLMDCLHCGWPVLEVRLEPRPNGPLPRVTHLFGTALLATDSLGNGVHECPTPYARPPVPPVARICVGGECDLNGDGIADVRDLVLMVHCILGNAPCPNPTPSDLDCDGNGTLSVDDVLCCARTVLGGARPDTLHGRPEPDVHVVFGQPLRDGDRVELPVTLDGAHRLGAARLAIRFPAERYDLESAALDGSPAEWLSLHEVRGGEVVVALIGLSGGSRPDLVLRLRLKLKQGMPPGGEVALASADFAGPEGTALEVQSGRPMRSLGALTPLELSIPRPNPFARSTDFAIILAQASQLEVAVYDLAGREVRELFRGGTPAGTLELRWDGRGADGARAAGGLYFLRARGAGQSSSRKLVLLSTP